MQVGAKELTAFMKATQEFEKLADMVKTIKNDNHVGVKLYDNVISVQGKDVLLRLTANKEDNIAYVLCLMPPDAKRKDTRFETVKIPYDLLCKAEKECDMEVCVFSQIMVFAKSLKELFETVKKDGD